MAREHAVVLGGSISGLLSAAALSGEFKRVTIVDRDELIVDGPEALKSRRGVPQGDQVHHLLALGAERIEELLPGFGDDLIAAGGERHDNLAAFAQYAGGVWRARFDSDVHLTNFTRPLFEGVVRRRVLALDNVAAHKGMVADVVADETGTILGARVKNAPGGQILGDLVVDATGRGTKAPTWFEDLGFERPVESHLRVYMGYTCFRVRIPEGVFPDGITSVTCAPTKDKPVGLVIWPCGNGEHIAVAAGVTKHYPPTDVEGVIAAGDALPSPLVGQYLRAAEVLSEPKSYKMVSDQRLRWEDLGRRPEGFIVVGDAVASYNPTYGQGMTMAAVAAVELRTLLREWGAETTGFATAFQQRLAPHVDIAWRNAISIDSIYDGVEYENQEPPEQPTAEAAAAFLQLQAVDPEVALAARLATHWMDNGYVEDDRIQRKVADWISQGRQVDPELADPLVIPPLVAGSA